MTGRGVLITMRCGSSKSLPFVRGRAVPSPETSQSARRKNTRPANEERARRRREEGEKRAKGAAKGRAEQAEQSRPSGAGG